MHGVHAINARDIKGEDTRPRRIKVHPARTRTAGPQPRAPGQNRLGQSLSSGVFLDVAGLQHRGDHFSMARILQRRDSIRRQDRPFGQPPTLGQTQRMGQDRAFGLGQWYGSELHDARRKVWIISARIDTAISCGLAAPISRPMGPWIRPISASLNPASCRRATRLAWVRVEPRAPI